IDSDSWAQQAGLRYDDIIIGARVVGQAEPADTPGTMLKLLATAEGETTIALSVRRIDAHGGTTLLSFQEPVPAKPFYTEWAQWPLGFIPHEGGRETLLPAMFIVIIGLTVITI